MQFCQFHHVISIHTITGTTVSLLSLPNPSFRKFDIVSKLFDIVISIVDVSNMEI